MSARSGGGVAVAAARSPRWWAELYDDSRHAVTDTEETEHEEETQS